MNREIKTRVWDKQECQWLKDDHAVKADGTLIIDDGYEWTAPADLDRFVVVQSTGLKDKNGKEIYEGDIVKRNGHILTIIFKDGAFGIDKSDCGLDHLTAMHHGHSLYNFMSDIEVIGNIFEHSDLLDK